MIKKIITLLKLGRKLAKSDALDIVSKFINQPLSIKLVFKILGFSLTKKKEINENENEGKRLSASLQSMGTTFIKLGQFLATRPDIIGEKLSIHLETLQDKLPPFELSKAKQMIKKDLGNENYNSIINKSGLSNLQCDLSPKPFLKDLSKTGTFNSPFILQFNNFSRINFTE